MTDSLKNVTKKHFQDRALNDDQLAALLDLQQHSEPTDTKPVRWYQLWQPSLWQPSLWQPSLWQPSLWQQPLFTHAAFAAIGACVAFILTLLFLNSPSMPSAEQIAQEVAENHINLKPADIETDSFNEIQHYFTRLDFVPIQSQLIAHNDWAITGARYCSILGKTAAQLRIRQHGSDRVQTVYQTIYDPSQSLGLPRLKSGQAPMQITVRGLPVKIWVEHDILFAMTATKS